METPGSCLPQIRKSGHASSGFCGFPQISVPSQGLACWFVSLGSGLILLGITSSEASPASKAKPASAAAQASPAAMNADLHVTHRQTKQTHIFFRAFSGFCGPSPVLRAFSGFAGLLRVCVLPQPLRARSFLFLFFKKNRKLRRHCPLGKSLWPKMRYLTVKTHIGFPPGYRAFSFYFNFIFFGRFPPAGSASP